MIAGSFGVSAALEQSGGAAAIANVIVDIGKKAGGGEHAELAGLRCIRFRGRLVQLC